VPYVTLIGEKIARKNAEFVYIGPNNDCRNCKLKTVCFNLKPGRSYIIKKVRDKVHNCNVHEGKSVVIEVEELPIITSIDSKYSEGSKVKIEKEECTNIGCEHFDLCKIKIQKDKEYTIVKVVEKIKCPIGLNIVKAELGEK
jgi:uncharacterized protein (UPF0179 family)